MPQVWPIQEAKSKFSRVIENAVNSGPQIITKRGVVAVDTKKAAGHLSRVFSRF